MPAMESAPVVVKVVFLVIVALLVSVRAPEEALKVKEFAARGVKAVERSKDHAPGWARVSAPAVPACLSSPG
ncbi:MAG: hypothetical protein LW822_11175 [Phycisphaeraceae bacterium]|nr:hypothetical protein [Phycisphaeraceae bacterium]